MSASRRSRASRVALAISAGLMLLLFAKVFHWASAAKRTAPVITALGWHLHHGFHVEMHEIQFRIPLSYEANSDFSNGILFMKSIPGRFLYKVTAPEQLNFALIGIGFRSPPDAFAPSMMPLAAVMQRLGQTLVNRNYQKTGERAVTLAGRPGNCLEYNGPPLADGGIPIGNKNIQIFCSFDDQASATFSGTPKAVEDFYSLLKTAKPIGHP